MDFYRRHLFNQKMYYTTDQDLIEDFHLRSGHSVGSKKSYRTVFNKYTAFHNMSLCDLLAEAITEQENHTPENRLSIYDRIISFRDYLTKVNKNDLISFEDLPTKDELRLAMQFADDDLKMWIMVIISSGASRCEAKSMTNRTLFEGTRAYHKKDNFHDALKYLARNNNVVCTCKLVRQKTDKPYYTFLNPECVQRIAKIKLKQEDFDLDAPLLKYNLNHVNHKFKKLNDYLGFGEVGGYARLRPHMLRKFNSTYLTQGSFEGDLLGMDSVDLLHGRGKNKTRQAYYKDNPEYLKLEYIKVMNNVSLYRRYDWKIVNGKVKVISKPL